MRTPSEYKRIYGSKERVQWVQSLPCVNCGARGRTVNAHTENGGMSRKGNYTTVVPLCSSINPLGCHERQHQHGWSVLRTLNTPHKRKVAAAMYEAAWLASLPPLEASRP